MLGNNPTQMDSYNKTTKTGQGRLALNKGTLVANWYEQRVHRDEKGEGRAMTKTHFPKKHDELHLSDGFEPRKNQDDTKYRVLGSTNYPIGTTQNYHYGKSKNKADQLQSVGRKTKMAEQMYLKQIVQEIQNEQKQKIQNERKAHFETTHRTSFVPKPLDQNCVGRLIMRDQSGALVGLENVDEDLRETNGFRERGQISKDEELRKLIDIDHGYERAEPITFWKQKIQDGTFYMSNPTKSQFGKNNEFLKTFKSYKHYHD